MKFWLEIITPILVPIVLALSTFLFSLALDVEKLQAESSHLKVFHLKIEKKIDDIHWYLLKDKK